MIDRRLFMLGLTAFPTLARSEATMLKATDQPDELEANLQNALVGVSLSEVDEVLANAGANSPMLVDIGTSDLPKGTDLGDGVKAGDQVAFATFGLARKFWQADLRVRVQIRYDEEGIVTEVNSIQRIAK